MLATDFPAGFIDPVLDSQGVFRAVLHALSHPGTVTDIPVTLESPRPLSAATAAICLALLDHETPVWLQTDALESWLRFHCGSPIVKTTAQARFAIIHDAAAIPPLEQFDLGNDEYPDRSTTLIIQVESFTQDELTLSGPGIRDSARFGVHGLRTGFWDEWRGLAPLFPCGIDLIFTTGTRVAAVPRTTRIGG